MPVSRNGDWPDARVQSSSRSNLGYEKGHPSGVALFAGEPEISPGRSSRILQKQYGYREVVFALEQSQRVRRIHGWTFRWIPGAEEDSRKGEFQDQVHESPCQKLQVDSDLARRLLATGVPDDPLHYIGSGAAVGIGACDTWVPSGAGPPSRRDSEHLLPVVAVTHRVAAAFHQV